MSIRKRSVSFRSDYLTKTVKQTVSVSDQDLSHQLLSQKLLEKHMRQVYNYLHILIWVTTKPMVW